MAEPFLLRVLPVLSNLAFLPASARALEYGKGFQAFIWMFVALFTSPSYHLCIGFGTCLWAVYKHHVVDFWSAEIAMPLVALDFVRFRSPMLAKWIILFSLVAIGLLVTGTRSNFMDQAIIGGVSGGCVIVYLLWYKGAHGEWPEYDMTQMVLGIGFLMLGVCFFVVQEWWPPYYGYNHSYWHVSVAIGVYFMIGIVEPADQRLNLDSRIQSALVTINDLVPAPRPKWLTDFRARNTPFRV